MSINPTLYYAGILLSLIAILPMPGDYYTFHRIAMCIISIYIVIQLVGANYPLWLLFIGSAILYNPIWPIYLYDKGTWQVINLITAIAIYFALRSKIFYEYQLRSSDHFTHGTNNWRKHQDIRNIRSAPIPLDAIENDIREDQDVVENGKDNYTEKPNKIEGNDELSRYVNLEKVISILDKEFSVTFDEKQKDSLKEFPLGSEYDAALAYMTLHIADEIENGSASAEIVDMQTRKILSLINRFVAARSSTIYVVNKFREAMSLKKIY